MNQVTQIMMPYIGKLIELSCYQEEEPNLDLVQEKVAEVFEDFKKTITAIVQPPAEESMATTLKRRYGEGTGDHIREMLDSFIASKGEDTEVEIYFTVLYLLKNSLENIKKHLQYF